MVFDQADNDIVWISGTVSNFVMAASGSGGVLVCCLSGGALNGPFGIDLGANGNLFVTSFNKNEIVVLNRSQSFSTFASGGGLSSPSFLIADAPSTLTIPQPASLVWLAVGVFEIAARRSKCRLGAA